MIRSFPCHFIVFYHVNRYNNYNKNYQPKWSHYIYDNYTIWQHCLFKQVMTSHTEVSLHNHQTSTQASALIHTSQLKVFVQANQLTKTLLHLIDSPFGSYCMIGTYMLLANVRIHDHWAPPLVLQLANQHGLNHLRKFGYQDPDQVWRAP